MGNSKSHLREKAEPQISTNLSRDKQLPECVEHLHAQSEKQKTEETSRWNKDVEARSSSHTVYFSKMSVCSHLGHPLLPIYTGAAKPSEFI